MMNSRLVIRKNLSGQHEIRRAGKKDAPAIAAELWADPTSGLPLGANGDRLSNSRPLLTVVCISLRLGGPFSTQFTKHRSRISEIISELRSNGQHRRPTPTANTNGQQYVYVRHVAEELVSNKHTYLTLHT